MCAMQVLVVSPSLARNPQSHGGSGVLGGGYTRFGSVIIKKTLNKKKNGKAATSKVAFEKQRLRRNSTVRVAQEKGSNNSS